MDMEFKDVSAPELTLDPFKEAEKSEIVKAAEPDDSQVRGIYCQRWFPPLHILI